MKTFTCAVRAYFAGKHKTILLEFEVKAESIVNACAAAEKLCIHVLKTNYAEPISDVRAVYCHENFSDEAQMMLPIPARADLN